MRKTSHDPGSERCSPLARTTPAGMTGEATVSDPEGLTPADTYAEVVFRNAADASSPAPTAMATVVTP